MIYASIKSKSVSKIELISSYIVINTPIIFVPLTKLLYYQILQSLLDHTLRYI
jgi:hypothetical protein